MIGPRFLGIVWIVVGAVVAANRHYFASLDTVREIGSAVLATLLWPLLLLGIDLHVR